MRTVAERLRRLRSRALRDPSVTFPSWIPDDVVDGAGLLRAFRALPPEARAANAFDLARLGLRAALPDLLELLRSGPSYVEPAKAVQAFLRDSDVPDLLAILEAASSAHQRQMVIYSMMSPRLSRHPSATAMLLRIAGDQGQDVVVRGQALEALDFHRPRGKLARSAAEAVVLAGLDDPDLEVAYNAAWAAGALRLRGARGRLIQLEMSDDRVYKGLHSLAEAAREARAEIDGEGPAHVT